MRIIDVTTVICFFQAILLLSVNQNRYQKLPAYHHLQVLVILHCNDYFQCKGLKNYLSAITSSASTSEEMQLVSITDNQMTLSGIILLQNIMICE